MDSSQRSTYVRLIIRRLLVPAACSALAIGALAACRAEDLAEAGAPPPTRSGGVPRATGRVAQQAGAPSGAVPGTFTTGANGDARYAIAIDLPPGIRGVQPALTLAYGSLAGDDRAGVGWHVDGPSAITRCKEIPAIDSVRGSINYNASDAFCLDGQRLINVSGAYGSPGSVYRTELDTFRRITASADRCGSGPCSFTVTMTSGASWSYGGDRQSGSRVLAVGRADVRVWALDRARDLNHNAAAFSYTEAPTANTSASDGQYYLARIDYTSNDAAGVAANRSVRLRYEPRPDVGSAYIGGAPVITRARLTGVTTYVGDTAVKDYRVSYRLSQATGRSTIGQIALCAGTDAGAPCLPATAFTWQDDATLAVAGQGLGVQLASGYTSILPADVNGDGRGDLIYISGGSTPAAYVYLSTGSALSACTGSLPLAGASAQQLLPMDVNGDGRTDLVQLWSSSGVLHATVYLANPAACGYLPGQSGSLQQSSAYTRVFPMDADGDGRTDLVLGTASRGQLQLAILLSTGAGFTTRGSASIPDVAGGTLWPMDVNADGMVDLVQSWTAQGALHVSAYRSTGTGLQAGVDTSLASGTTGTLQIFPLDVNGDGQIDLVQAWPDASNLLQLSSFLATGDGHFVAAGTVSTQRAASATAALWPMDINGDGRTDLVQAWRDGGRVALVAYRNLGTAFDRGTVVLTGLSSAQLTATFPIDYDGDGRVDLIQAWPDGAALSVTGYRWQGPIPDLVGAIRDGWGGNVAISYAPSSDPSVYQPVAGPGYPASDAMGTVQTETPAQAPFQVVAGGKLQLVAQTVASGTIAGEAPYSYTDSYQYAGALIDRSGRGWLGYRTVNKLDHQRGQRVVTTYNQAFPRTGTIADLTYECDARFSPDKRCPVGKSDTLLTASQTAYTPVVTATGATQPNPSVYFVQKTSTQTFTYDYGAYASSRMTTYRYDAWGNVIDETDLGYVTRDGHDLSTSDNVYSCTAYANDASAWRLGYVTDTKVSGDSASCSSFTTFSPATDLARTHRTYTTDGRMNLASSAMWDSGNGVFLTTTWTYDGFGNGRSETQPGNRTLTLTYDAQYHTYLDTRTFPPDATGLRLTEAYGFDPRFGVQVALRTVGGQIRETCLDGFGRIAYQLGPVPPGIKPDVGIPACRSALMSGSNRATFLAAPQVELEARSWLADAGGAPYERADELQSFPTGDTLAMLWSRTYYDGRGRDYKRLSQGDPSTGNTVACTTYDSDNHTIGQSIPELVAGDGPGCAMGQASPKLWTTTTLDVYGRVIQQVSPAGALGTETTVTTTSYTGDTATVTYAAQDPYRYQKIFTYRDYHDVRKPVTIVVPDDGNATTSYQYDRIGRLIGTTDPPTADNPAGVTNTVVYDSLGRQVTIDNPDQNTIGGSARATRYLYSKTNGYLVSATDAKGQVTASQYDALGRILSTRLADGASFAYRYDDPAVDNGRGQLTHVEGRDAAGALTYQYDYSYDVYGNQASRVVTLAGEPAPYTVRRAYDPQARVVQITYPDSTALVRGYSFGNLANLTMAGTTYASFSQYTALRTPQAVAYGNGVHTQLSYAPEGELTREVVKDSARETMMDRSLAWDHLFEVTQNLDNAKLGGTDFTQTFTYQSRRLGRATAPGLYGDAAFGYDASGNLTGNAGVTYRYQAHRIMSGTQGGKPAFTATYDGDGNMLSKQDDGHTLRYDYDAANRLTRVQQDGAVTLSGLTYDHEGKRLSKLDNTGAKALYVDPAYIVTRVAGGVEATRNIASDGDAVAALTTTVSGTISGTGPGTPTPGVVYFHSDHLGTTAMTSGATGRRQTQLAYMPYGRVYTARLLGPDNFRPKFQGKELDQTTTLYYFGARYYDPSLGRFLTPDSELASQLYRSDALNRFAFALNNPVTYSDPTGHNVWQSIAGVAIGLVEITLGVAVDVLSDGALEPLGGALIGAGLNGVTYAATNSGNFSWKQYGIQQGMGAALGVLTGGFGAEADAGLSVAEAEVTEVGESSTVEAAEGLQQASLTADRGALDSSTTTLSRDASAELDSVEDAQRCVFSFAAGTAVLTPLGRTPIEAVQRGDLVLSEDDQTGSVAWQPVTQTHQRVAEDRVDLEVVGDDGARDRVRTTLDHRFWVHDRGWLRVAQIAPGDEIFTAQQTWSHVVGLASVATVEVVYNFEVEGYRTYFVGELGLWVHNPCEAINKGGTSPQGYQYDVELRMSKSEYPQSAQHIQDAQQAGHDDVLTIDRPGARANRRDSLRGIKTKPGLDRDEYPPAMFEEGGTGADIELIDSKDNRASGSSFGGQLRSYPNGTRVWFRIVK